MNKLKEVFIFDMKTGITMKFKSRTEARDAINLRSVSSIKTALDEDKTLKDRFKARTKRLKRVEKDALFSQYWTPERLKHEKWKQGPDGIKISSLGRAHNGERFLYPSMLNERSILIKQNKKFYNLTRLVCELFVVKRKLTSQEVAFRRGHYLEFGADMVYVGTWEDYRLRGIRANSKDVVLLNDDGSVKEYYFTIKEAAEKNFIARGALCIAIKKGRPCCGKVFRRAKESDY